MTSRRESAIKSLHNVATSVQKVETFDAVCDQTVSAAADILEFKLCTVLIREDDWLVPYAVSKDAPPDGSRRMRIDQGLAGKTYQTGTSQLVAEISSTDQTDPAKNSYRSAMSVPIRDHGVFQAVSTEPHTFHDEDLELAELLVSHTATALDRIEREQELQRHSDRLEQFASVISHDLRNPLNVAATRLELATEECDSSHLQDIADAHCRMEEMIEDVLALSRAGATVEDPEQIGLVDVVRESWKTVMTDGAELELQVPLGVTIAADRPRLQHVFENLFRNAVDHNDSPLTIQVGLIENDGTGDTTGGIFIADDGDGVPEDERDIIFEYGYSTGEGGTGVGLSVVADVVDGHGWDVIVTESDESGARFEITGISISN